MPARGPKRGGPGAAGASSREPPLNPVAARADTSLMASPNSRALNIYVAAVTTAGFATLALMSVALDTRDVRSTPAVWVLAAFLVLGEWAPIRVPWRDGSQNVTLSTTFVFALVLLVGAPFAAIAQALASALPDVVARRPWWKTVFNAAQYVLAVAAAGGVLSLVGYEPVLHSGGVTPSMLLAAFAGGVAFYLVNNLLVGSAVALHQGLTLFDYMRSDLLFQAATTLVLLSQAPLIVIVAGHGIWLIPMFLPAMATAYRAARASIQRDHDALHDALTGLPNRKHFLDRVSRAIEERPSDAFTVLILDADQFRDVNDTLGPDIGDRMLCQLGTRLAESFDGIGFVAHLGGDEFGVYAPAADRDELDRLRSLTRTCLAEPFDLDGLPFDLDMSVGAAIYPEHGTAANVLLQRADVAMYFAKERHTDFAAYHPNIDKYDPKRLALLGELRPALENGQFVVHYQPQADVVSGEVLGVEALVRWEHPQHGLIPPDEFIPLVEATGIIGPLTIFVATEALAQCRRWRDAGFDLTVAVNVSARSLHDPTLPEQIATLLVEHRLPAAAFHIEVTESAAMEDPDLAIEVLGRIRDLGVSIALDDFGTGHSSLAHMRRLPIEAVKIDKSFVIGMLTDAQDAAIVASTIDLGHSLGLRVIAEGVESDASWRRLAEFGCDVLQGYMLSRPLPADKLTTWLHASMASPMRSTLAAPCTLLSAATSSARSARG